MSLRAMAGGKGRPEGRDRAPVRRLACALAAPALGLLALVATGCEEERQGLLLEVMAQEPIRDITVHVKHYRDDGGVELFQPERAEVTDDKFEYVVGRGGAPIRLQIELPYGGRYAVHLVSRPMDATFAPLTATVCYFVSGVIVDHGVFLGLLGPELDWDLDTFPEDLEAYCNARQEAGLVCDLTCHSSAFSALVDCNPPGDLESPCGAPIADSSDAEAWETFVRGWNPFAVDDCADCFDQDCYGGDARCEDLDHDGFPSDVDCNDRDPRINPDAEDVCCNGIDENCRVDNPGCEQGDRLCDEDGDGFVGCGVCDGPCPDCYTDCDDTDPEVNPRALEVCGDGRDNDCDGRIDEGCIADDVDDDGVDGADGSDCNDCDSAIGSGFPELCGNEIDEDCDGFDSPCGGSDQDGDGWAAPPAGDDCDDGDPFSFPGAPDFCGDGIAQDCGSDLPCSADADADGDRYSGGAGGDCDDTDASVHPWAVELCDRAGVDENCDGRVNEVLDRTGTEGCGLDADGAWYRIVFATDVNHCGRCRHGCETPSTSEGDRCEGGLCLCGTLGRGCGGSIEDYCCTSPVEGCFDLTRDVAHCGHCRTACSPNETCEPLGPGGLGECRCEGGEPCPADTCWSCCPAVGCVNVCESRDHCGGCGVDCDAGDRPAGDRCSAGRCSCGGETCSSGEWCTNVTHPPGCNCANLDEDGLNCGTCGNVCDEGEACVAGQCRCGSTGPDCAGGSTSYCCPGTGCQNLLTDVNHCGMCGRRCAWGESCVGGECRCGSNPGCPALHDCCSGTCYAVLTDAAHCGPVGTGFGCTNACRPGSACRSGSCSCGTGSDCGSGETCCPGPPAFCASLASDFNNCGACGTRCRAGEQCTSSACACTPTCSDGVSCTEDSCVGGRCEHRTLDADDDGYCAASCLDSASGSPGDCIDGDCDDTRPGVHPGAPELCSTSYDDDCDGSTNDRDAVGCTVFYLDADGDGYGTSESRCYCVPSGNYRATVSGDCNDGNASIRPGATERCNRVDDDCDPATADGSGESWYGNPCDGSDADLCLEGTWGCSATGTQVCSDPNDADPDLCDGVDNDCNPATPDGSGESWYGTPCDGTDADLCLEGTWVCAGSPPVQTCNDPNDADPEVCDGIDNDCNPATPDDAECPGLCCGTPRACRACCSAAQCGAGAWTCTGYACSCAGVVCGGTCHHPGDCCVDGECGDGDSCTVDRCVDHLCTHTAPACSMTADSCCPSACTVANDRDCCNAVACSGTTSDGCCPSGCNHGSDTDC